MGCVLGTNVGALTGESNATGGVSSFGYNGTIVHTVLSVASGTTPILRCPSLVFRRKEFPWREFEPAPITDSALWPTCKHVRTVSIAHRKKNEQEHLFNHEDGELIQLVWNEEVKVAVLVLNHVTRFNALSADLSHDLALALSFLRKHNGIRAMVLQGAGPHFCIGAYPYAKHVHLSVANMASSLVATALSCCSLREQEGSVIAAVHGYLAGGGIALCLNASYRVSECSATFNHANLPRGVCPIAEFSQTLGACVGTVAASSMYLSDVVVGAHEAQSLGLVQEACVGVDTCKERARQLAAASARGGVLNVRHLADSSTIALEALYHAECISVNHGEAKPTTSLMAAAPADIRWEDGLFGLDADSGVAAVRLNVVSSKWAACLGSVADRLSALGSELRVIVLHVICGGRQSVGRSARAGAHLRSSIEALHSLGVPIVGWASGVVGDDELAVWSAADYRIAELATSFGLGAVDEEAACSVQRLGMAHEVVSGWAAAQARSAQFAGWLARQPVIG